ncbi:MAG TPA: methyltransferase domain-containing protein [Pseudonocardiaceae bacterium]|jgi:tocopherol O-methyltransferase|nr:methyltransferase domain-containing protein [Pseudonocardiaceae bacterium]
MSQDQDVTSGTSHEGVVRDYYDPAREAYKGLMGDTWHHGDPAAEAAGLSVLEAAQALERRMVSLSGLGAGERALDFGSGVGGPTVYLATVSGAHFVGLSNNEGLSADARALAERVGVTEKVSFHTIGDTDYKTLGAFADDSFDAVFFFESTCHLPDKQAFFQAAYRILKPGHRLVGIDWLQRPFGAHQTDEQIMRFMEPVNRFIRIPWHGTVDSYRTMLEQAGFQIEHAEDLFDGVECWGSTPDEDRPQWLNYDGPHGELFREGKRALDAARGAGVFTVGLFAAVKPA